MKQLFRLLVLLPLLPGFLCAQVGQEAGIGIYGGTAFLKHVIRGDDGDGAYTPDRSHAYYGGIEISQPIHQTMALGLELGFQQNTFAYRYSTGRVRTHVVTDMTYYSLIWAPSLTYRPSYLGGLFGRVAIPFALKAGNNGTYFLEDNPNWVLVRTDLSNQVGHYRNLVYVGPEISLGYLYTWKSGTGFWIRGSTWAAATRFWKQSFAATPENPTLKRLSIELGFRMGTPGLRLIRSAYKPVDPN